MDYSIIMYYPECSRYVCENTNSSLTDRLWNKYICLKTQSLFDWTLAC